MKTVFLSFLFLIALKPSEQRNSPIISTSRQGPILSKLKANKAGADQYVARHGKNLIVLVKVPGKKNLIRIINEKWPDEIEYTYNIMIGQSGAVIYIAQIPFSESGDWDIEYKHYFDERGNTYAFSKEESIFDDNVKGGIVRAALLKYFDSGFKNMNQVDKLTDKDGREINKKRNDFDFREYKYNIYKNLSEYLAAYNIALKS